MSKDTKNWEDIEKTHGTYESRVMEESEAGDDVERIENALILKRLVQSSDMHRFVRKSIGSTNWKNECEHEGALFIGFSINFAYILKQRMKQKRLPRGLITGPRLQYYIN